MSTEAASKMPQQPLDPGYVFLLAFGTSSLAGLAALLRSGQTISIRSLLSAWLNSGLLGLAIAFIWYNYFEGDQNPWFLLGVSILAGLGGYTVIDFVITLLVSKGWNITIHTDKLESKEGSHREIDV
jgi:hypothetical protein